ncbi:beta strand repeat-containing protein [Candidatus Mycoplasma mahonii]|uniref:beta strand repeat-containing protein n=1 Tax=Candidatus Mycoplasma mahonii TaxID=3004105 RepID=UPI0026F2CEFD|nr:lipoprotein 17-related variable surface protein [Candidatus Mycoplasma mahonii]WKX02380.1 lipoprotein 17-related variable surface protein [Candidatus Mycoplasma mahonii]
MKKTKKLALGFGMVTTVIAPVAVAISCDEESPTKKPVDDSPVQAPIDDSPVPAPIDDSPVPAPIDDSPVPAPFALKNDLVFFTDVSSLKNKYDLETAINSVKVITPDVLGISEPTLTSGVTVRYAIATPFYDQTNAVVVRVTLTKENKIARKNIIITPFVFTNDLALFTNTLSSKNKADLKTAIINSAKDITPDVLGITEPTLTSGVTARYAIITPLNDQTGVVTVSVTLTNGTKTASKNITITPPFVFTNDLALFTNTLSSKNKYDLKTDIDLATVITPDVLGITKQTLTSGVRASAIITSFNDQTGAVIVLITLTKGTETANKNITITPIQPFDFTNNLALFTNTLSSKNKADLKTAIDSAKAITPDVLGIIEPILASGVIATYDIKTYNDQTGVVTVTVALTNLTNGIKIASKNITITPPTPPTVLTNNLALFTNTLSSKNKYDLKTAINSAKDITPNVLGISEPSLTSGVTATYAIATPLNDQTGVVIVNVTLTKGTKTVNKNITITAPFDLTADLAFFTNTSSSKNRDDLKIDIASAPGGVITPNVLGITEPTLTSGVTATYTITTPLNDDTGAVNVLITLTNGTETVNKSITITAPFDLTADLAFFTNTSSSKNKYDLKTAINSAKDITPNVLGISEPSLTSGVTATYAIATPLNDQTGVVIVNVTLTKGTKTVNKNITITAPFDLTADLAFFTNTSSSKNRDDLKIDIASAPGGVITPNVLGITEPSLTSGVTATYTITTPLNDDTGAVTVLITLTNGTETVNKSITITAPFIFINDLARFTDVSSSRTKDVLIFAISSAPGGVITPNVLGITEPTLTSGVTAKYTITTPLKNETNAVTVLITLTKGTQTAIKNIKITPFVSFALTADLAFFTNTSSSKNRDDLKIDIASAPGGVITPNVLGITEPSLTSGVTTTYTITTPLNDDTGAVTVLITLTNGTETASKNITITAPTALVTNLALFTDVSSSKNRADLETAINSANGDITPDELGIIEPTLTSDVTATYAIIKPLYDQGVVIVRVTLLTKGGAKTISKNITITAAS